MPDQSVFSCLLLIGWLVGSVANLEHRQKLRKVSEAEGEEGSERVCSTLQSLWEDYGVMFVCRIIYAVAMCIFVHSTSLCARSGMRHKYIVVKKLISDRGDMSWSGSVTWSHARVRQEDPGNGVQAPQSLFFFFTVIKAAVIPDNLDNK